MKPALRSILISDAYGAAHGWRFPGGGRKEWGASRRAWGSLTSPVPRTKRLLTKRRSRIEHWWRHLPAAERSRYERAIALSIKDYNDGLRARSMKVNVMIAEIQARIAAMREARA